MQGSLLPLQRGAAALSWVIQGARGMCSAGARGRMTFEAGSADENLTLPLVLLIIDRGGTFEVSMMETSSP